MSDMHFKSNIKGSSGNMQETYETSAVVYQEVLWLSCENVAKNDKLLLEAQPKYYTLLFINCGANHKIVQKIMKVWRSIFTYQ